MVSVVDQGRAQSNGGNAAAPAIGTTPIAGDVAYVATIGNRSTPRTISSVSGLSATWSEVYNSGDSRLTVWKGTSPSTSGSVTVTYSGTQSATSAAWLVRDLSGTALSASYTNGTTSPLAGPSDSAGNGQVVLDILVSSNLTFPSSQTPATGWTFATNGTASGAAYRVPSATETHQLEVSFTGSPSSYLGQIVLGTAGISGGQAVETDSALPGSLVITQAGPVEETDTALPGSPTTLIAGGQAEEIDTALAGQANQTILGALATETDTALTGTLVSGGPQTINGGQATETDTALTGLVRQLRVGGQAVETDTALAGGPIVVIVGGQALETESALPGIALETIRWKGVLLIDGADTTAGLDPSPRAIVTDPTTIGAITFEDTELTLVETLYEEEFQIVSTPTTEVVTVTASSQADMDFQLVDQGTQVQESYNSGERLQIVDVEPPVTYDLNS